MEKVHNPYATLTFYLEEDNNISYANLRGERYGAPITNTIVSWLCQERLEDRQVAALTRYLRRLDRTLDKNFEKTDAYTSRYSRSFKLTPKLQEYMKHYQTKLF